MIIEDGCLGYLANGTCICEDLPTNGNTCDDPVTTCVEDPNTCVSCPNHTYINPDPTGPSDFCLP